MCESLNQKCRWQILFFRKIKLLNLNKKFLFKGGEVYYNFRALGCAGAPRGPRLHRSASGPPTPLRSQDPTQAYCYSGQGLSLLIDTFSHGSQGMRDVFTPRVLYSLPVLSFLPGDADQPAAAAQSANWRERVTACLPAACFAPEPDPNSVQTTSISGFCLKATGWTG